MWKGMLYFLLLMTRRPPRSPDTDKRIPSTTLFRYPDRNPENRHRAPAIGNHSQVQGTDASERQPGIVRKELGVMQLDRADQPGRRGQHQPDHGTEIG